MDLFIRNLIDSVKVNLTVKQCLVLFSKDFNTIPSLRDKSGIKKYANQYIDWTSKISNLI